jgi:hypothetical protein
MAARLTPRRLLVLLGIAATVALTSACGGGQDAAAAAKDPQLLKYSDRYVSFTYPTAWAASRPKGPGELHFHPLVYLGTQPVHDACSVHANETTCDWPIRHLQPGGVLALWQLPYVGPTGPMGPTPQETRIQVGGHTAWRQDTKGGDCRRIGADRTIDVLVPSANPIELTVCLRGPGLARNERRLDALLASTQFPAS